jgi:hypothetical protein
VSVDNANLRLLYNLNESQPKATRANTGTIGSAQDLTVVQSSGSDGIPTVQDGNGGRATDHFLTRTGWTTASRCLRGAQGTGGTHAAYPTMPTASALDDFAFGCRFQWNAGNVGGGALESEVLFMLGSVANAGQFAWGIGVLPNDATTPTAGQFRLWLMGTAVTVAAAAFTIVGAPPTQYVLPNEWYRVVVRVIYSGTGVRAVIYLVRESTGAVYTFTEIADHSTANKSAFEAATDIAVHVSYQPVSSTFDLRAGYVDEAWLYDAPLSDTDATSTVAGGFTVPWTPPSYRVVAQVCYAACTREGASYPITRPLPTGKAWSRYPADVFCQRARFRVEGWRPGRPWLLRTLEGTFDTVGPFSAKQGNRFALDDLTVGLLRIPGPLPAGAWEDARNVETSLFGPRRRRGYKVRRNVATDQGDSSANAFAFFRTNDQSLYGIFKVGTKMYEETGSAAVSLEAGWNPQQKPQFLSFDNRLVILSGSRRRTWRGQSGSTDSYGVTAGTTATVATIVGTLAGAYYYAWTEYDPTTGDESAPKVSALISPATQGVRLTMDAINSDTRFSQRRIYRTTNGGSAPNLFRLATITSATTYDDTAGADGTVLVGQVIDSSGTLLGYLTGALPDTFSIGAVHMERLFLSGGTSYPDRVYVTEENEPQRFYSDFWLQASGVVRAIASWGHRLVVFTDTTVEIFESDWVRDSDANVNRQRTVLSVRRGAVGPHAVETTDQGGIFWLARDGVYTIRGGEVACISTTIKDLFPYLNHSLALRFVVRWNPIRNQLWVGVAHTTLQQGSTDRMQTVLVLDFDAYASGKEKWTPYELECTWFSSFDDDLNGQQFGVMDHLGVFAQMETYEGDGAQGDEAYTTEDEGGSSGSVGISSITGSVVTAFGAPGWVAGALRGFSVVLRDRSTGLLYWHKIADNTTTTLTVIGTPNAALAARDGYYIGGIRGYVQFAEQAFATANDKVVRQVVHSFADLTQTTLYR